MGEAVQGEHLTGSYPELKNSGNTLDFQAFQAQETREDMPALPRTAHTLQDQVVTEQDHTSHTLSLHLQWGKQPPACKASQL